MKKLAAEMTSTGTINKKVLGTLGAKKQLVRKTIFKLSPQWENFLRQLAKISDMTIRDFLDSLATIATKAYSNGTLQILPNNVDGKRMSYAISEDAKNVFTQLAKENNVSRDSIVESTLAYILKEFEKNALSTQEKIKYAIILDNAFKKMSEIYCSDEVSEARNKLISSGDPEFFECEEKFSYIEQLIEIDIQKYIEKKKHEIINS